MRNRQKGISLIGALISAAVILGALILGMRIVPVYTEYFAIKKALNGLASSAEASSPETIRILFDRRSGAEDINSVRKEDLVISKENGRWTISADWQRTIPIVANVSLLFQFSASSTSNAAASQ